MSRKLEEGIQAVRDGNIKEGARLIRIALKDRRLAPNLQAVGLIALGQTSDDVKYKIECYRRATQVDPQNKQAQNLLRDAMTEQIVPQNSTDGNPPSDTGRQTAVDDTGPQTMPPGIEPIPLQSDEYRAIFSGNTSIAMSPIPPELGTGPLDPSTVELARRASSGDTSGNIQTVDTGPLTPDLGQQKAKADPARKMVEGPVHLQNVQRTVGIFDGPNGFGTGFFVTRNGLIATTRYIVGGERQVKVELLDKRLMLGTVVRSFPDFDLAFVRVNVHLDHLMSVNQSPTLSDNVNIVAVTHKGEGLRSTKRATRHQTAAYWFPTVINHLRDAGGNPIFTEDNLLVGMLTKNAGRTNGYMYGLHINKIYMCVEQYHNEVRLYMGQDTAYCSACGILSRAPGLGGNYCEHCGNTLPHAVNATRHPQPQVNYLYGESQNHPCPNCSARVGYDKNRNMCLRCGYILRS